MRPLLGFLCIFLWISDPTTAAVSGLRRSRKIHTRKFQGAGGKLDCEGGFSIGRFSLGCSPGKDSSESPAQNGSETTARKGDGDQIKGQEQELAAGAEIVDRWEFRLPTKEEAAEIRENCTAPLPHPAFPPWRAPLEVFAAKLWSEHRLLPLDTATRGFYTANNKYFYDGKKHKDLRFVAPTNQSTSVREQLRDLLSSFMRFCDANGLHPWMAHGSLLGLTWSNRIMEYDDDLDMQIAFGEMAKLNASDQTMIDGVYLLDVNPHYPYRQLPGDQNVIDARITDVRSGVFLDITALSSVTPAMPNRVACKSPHFLDVDWIFPLRRSVLDGVEVWSPHDPTSVLASEYKASGYNTGPYLGHYFNFFTRRWESHDANKLVPKPSPTRQTRQDKSPSNPTAR